MFYFRWCRKQAIDLRHHLFFNNVFSAGALDILAANQHFPKYKQMRPKTILFACAVVYFLLFGCTPQDKSDSDLIHINLRGSFPVREIRLEEIADIEFLQLETHDDFLFRGFPQIITSEKIIIASPTNGNILVFSRDGSPISRFNRRGGGPEEFPRFGGIVFDETTNEIFVGTVGRIMVYSLTGEFIRRLPLPTLTGMSLGASYDSESLLLRNAQSFDRNPSLLTIISKKDGSVVSTIDIPPVEQIVDLSAPIRMPETGYYLRVGHNPFIRYNDGFLLNIHASDTVFLHRNGEMMPFLVRTPSLRSTNPPVLLKNFFETENFQFFDIQRLNLSVSGIEPITHLVRDKRTGSVYRQRIIFDDFRGKNVVIHHGTIRCSSGIGLIRLDLTELQDANDESRLSGRLQEIVESSYKFGNDVFMLLHFK